MADRSWYACLMRDSATATIGLLDLREADSDCPVAAMITFARRRRANARQALGSTKAYGRAHDDRTEGALGTAECRLHDAGVSSPPRPVG
jgi:hypothetical protein